MVLPHLDYCAVVWAECCKDDATKLERIQKSGMRLIVNEGWNCPSSVMRSRLGWTSLAKDDESSLHQKMYGTCHKLVTEFRGFAA